MQDFNLIITTQRGNERACVREFLMLMEEIHGPQAHLRRTRFPGLLTGHVDADPIDVCKKIKPLLEEDPWGVRFIQRVVPIQKNVEADLKGIKSAVEELSASIPQGASFRISVNKRGSDLRSADIIKVAAEVVKRRVDLDNPDWIIQIEIIDDRAGVSLLCEGDLVAVTKMQEKAMEEP